jgi:hypothetical protein
MAASSSTAYTIKDGEAGISASEPIRGSEYLRRAVRITWNDDAVRKAAIEGVGRLVGSQQALLDAVGTEARGQDVATVKATLRSRWQREFSSTPSDDLLQSMAEQLAAGMRVVLRVHGAPPQVA